jgi:hypothetical protein
VDETDFESLRLRYRFAFELYRDLVAVNAAMIGASDRPSIEQLQREQQALDDLSLARRDLLEAFSAINPSIH